MENFVSGARGVQDGANSVIVDLEKRLTYLNPKASGIGFVKKLGIGSKSVNNHKYNWTETKLATRREKVTLAAAGTTTMTVADARQYSKDQTIRIENEIVRVTAIASNTTLTIARGQAGTTAVAHTNVDAVKLGTAREENSTPSDSVTDGSERLFNFVQTFDKSVELSTHKIAQLQTEQGNPFTGQVNRRMIEIMQELAQSIFYGVRHEDTAGERYYMGGLKQFVTTNITDVGGAVSIAVIDNLIKAIIDAGGTPTDIVVGTTQKQKLDYLDANLIRTGKKDRVGGSSISQTWQSGLLDYPLEINVDHSLNEDELWVLDKGMIEVPKMSNNGAGHGFKLIDATADGQDGRKTVIRGHYGFKLKHEKSAGYAKNLDV